MTLRGKNGSRDLPHLTIATGQTQSLPHPGAITVSLPLSPQLQETLRTSGHVIGDTLTHGEESIFLEKVIQSLVCREEEDEDEGMEVDGGERTE